MVHGKEDGRAGDVHMHACMQVREAALRGLVSLLEPAPSCARPDADTQRGAGAAAESSGRRKESAVAERPAALPAERAGAELEGGGLGTAPLRYDTLTYALYEELLLERVVDAATVRELPSLPLLPQHSVHTRAMERMLRAGARAS